MATVDLEIDGMTCAGCAARVETALASVAGVSTARVNLALERATVDGEAKAQELVLAVERAGYGAWMRDTVDPAVKAAMDRAADRRAWVWLLISMLLTAPFVLQMLSMAVGLGWTMPYWLEPLMAAPVVFGAGGRFFSGAWHAVLARTGTMDLLVAMGTGAAFGYSLVMVLTQGAATEGPLYFEAAAVIVTLVLLGKRLEARAKADTSAAIRGLMALRPETARRETERGEETVAVDAIGAGDLVRVLPGERIPVDGRIVEGVSAIDESLITGESVPVTKQAGAAVVGGSINGDGLLRIEATAVGKDSTLAKIVRLVERAQSGTAPVQKLVDKVSAIFVPIVLALSLMTFIGWLAAGAGFEFALVAAVSVLVIACPCALGLASPTAIVAGMGAAAKSGILIKDVEAMERAATIEIVLFDKTGTITAGRPRLVRAIDAQNVELTSEALEDVVALLSGSGHPIAIAICQAFDNELDALAMPKEFRNWPGEGVTGIVAGRFLVFGNRTLMDRFGVPLAASVLARAEAMAEEGETVSYFARDGVLLGLFGTLDLPRAGAWDAIDSLKRIGIAVELLSGDSPIIAERVARQVGIDRVEAGVRPDRKASVVRSKQSGGLRVAMVGDGINDAPALVQADLGIAMGTGADVALDAAPVTLMRSDLALVLAALEICRKTVGKTRQNLFWAFVYNVVGLPLAALGCLSPAVAGAAMALSSVSVVTSSLLLLRWKP